VPIRLRTPIRLHVPLRLHAPDDLRAPAHVHPPRAQPRRHSHRSLALVLAIGALAVVLPSTAAAGYPARDAGYHDLGEMLADVRAVHRAHPDIVRVFSIGTSAKGRNVWAAEISDNVGTDEGEPEVLFDSLHHAREHLTLEQTLFILHLLADRYGGPGPLGQRVTGIVDSRRIWIVFAVNPDGFAYDLTGGPYGGGHYRGWRKNRQATPGSSAIGTDLNRNYSYAWGCCDGASKRPSADDYHGPRPWSAPEVRAMRDFVDSRVIDGRQRIRAHITFHSAAELVLWPYGYTYQDVPPDMTRRDHRTFVAMGRHMADTNGYTAKQSSGLYPTLGDQIDWMYARHRIFSYTFELYPSKSKDSTFRRFYPPDELIERETRRNREAVLYLMEQADCPYRAIGMEVDWCGPFADDLEIGRGWRTDPDGDDPATAGAWARGIPDADRPFQLPDAASGQAVLVTGRAQGTDVDGGRTTVRSTAFMLPAEATAELRFRYWVGLDAAAGQADGLRVRLVDAETGELLWRALRIDGDGTDQAAEWRSAAIPIPGELAGRTVAIELLAVDDPSADATVEAAVDDVRVVRP
jgi:murein tripeptide amidase MpaA